MTTDDGVAELKELYLRKDSLSDIEGPAWVERVSELLNLLAPARAAEFDQLTPYLFAGLSERALGPAWHRIGAIVRAAITDLDQLRGSERNTTGASTRFSPHTPDRATNPKSVFVVHGRNETLRSSIFAFLRAIGLDPIEWSQAVRDTGRAAPYIGEILVSAFARAQAVVVLLTPDDEVRLSESLWASDESSLERTVQRQARPNVLFEAGMAFGTHADRTVLVQIGPMKPFSDVGGRHVIHLDDSVEKRADLAQRLEQAGCPVDTSCRDWMSMGDFTFAAEGRADWPPASRQGASSDSVAAPKPKLDVTMGYLGSWRQKQIVIKNIGGAVALGIVVSANGAPIDQLPCWVMNQTLPPSLRPSEELGIKIAVSMSSPERVEITVRWKGEDGSEYVTERAVQLI